MDLLSRVTRTGKQQPEMQELAKSSPCREPHTHMEFSAQSRLFGDKTTNVWSRKPLILQRFCRNTDSQPHQLICNTEIPKIRGFCTEFCPQCYRSLSHQQAVSRAASSQWCSECGEQPEQALLQAGLTVV